MALGVFYRPNKLFSEFITTFDETLQFLSLNYEHVFCVGDFNVDLLDVSSYRATQLLDVIESAGMSQLITEPTRITQTSMTLLDLIITNSKSRVSPGVINLDDVADHFLIYCYIQIKCKQPYAAKRTYRDFKHFDHQLFCHHLESVPWDNLYHLNDVESKLDFLNVHLLAIFDTHAPLKTSTFRKPKAPWITETIKDMMLIRDKALKKYKRTKNIAHWNFYKDMRNLTTTAVKREKRAFLEYSVRYKSTRDLWVDLGRMNVHSKDKNNQLPPNLIDLNLINNFFVKSVDNLNVPYNLIDLYSNSVNNKITSLFEFKQVSETEILKIIHGIKTTACGLDGINITMLSYCCPCLLPYITHIINFCLMNSVFPNIWKSALVTPLPKCNNPTEYKDLRPISILPTLSKIMERVMTLQYTNFIEFNNILPNVQSGFRAKYSCCSALTHIIDDIITATDKNMLTILILLDFSKAFDVINHKLLLSILQYNGLGIGSCLLFDNYLKGRTQRVSYNGEFSDLLDVSKGVPQGSILGPLLYAVYTAHIGSYINHCKYHLYADDTQLYYSFELINLQQANIRINSDLDNVAIFALDHGLKINTSKTSMIIFGNKNSRRTAINLLDIKLDNQSLGFKDSVKNLGLIIDYKLRFKENTNKLIRNAFFSLKFLFSCRQFLNIRLKKMLCEALVLSHFNYCDTLYASCLDLSDIKRIQRVQNSCLRFIFGIRRRERISHKLMEVKWLNMANRRYLHTVCFFHKIICTGKPPYLASKIRYRTDVYALNARSRGLLSPPTHRTQLFRRCFSYVLPKLMNELSNMLTSSSSGFRKRIHQLRLYSQI